MARLRSVAIAGETLTLGDLLPGPSLAARARSARYQCLEEACRARGIVHLVLGHHAADQAETLAMRLLAGSLPDGLAGMPALRERHDVRLLRPLLAVPPARLRATLTQAGIGWVEDPSNSDPRALRSRLRLMRRDRAGNGPATRALSSAAAAYGTARAATESCSAEWLANRVSIHPEGYAVMAPGEIDQMALSALLQTLAGGEFAPPPDAVARLIASGCVGTLGGVRLLPAGREGPPGAILVVREAASVAGPVMAAPGAVWDRRFRLACAPLPDGTTVGALGADAPAMRRRSLLPSAVLRTLPALRIGKILAAVPHLDYPSAICCGDARFEPFFMSPVRCAPFFAATDMVGWRGCTTAGGTLC